MAPKNLHIRQLLAAVLLVVSALVFSLPAQAADNDLAASIDRLTATVDKLVQQKQAGESSLGQDEQLRRLSLAIAYLDYRSRRLEALEQEMSGNRDAQARLEDFMHQVERREDALEERLRDNPQLPQAEAEKSRKELEEQKKLVTDRAARIDGKLIQLDNEIAELKAQLVPVERFVQDNLRF